MSNFDKDSVKDLMLIHLLSHKTGCSFILYMMIILIIIIIKDIFYVGSAGLCLLILCIFTVCIQFHLLPSR